MSSPHVLLPRHEPVATRASTIMFLLGAAILAAYLVLQPRPVPPGVLPWAWAVFAALVLAGLSTCGPPGKWLSRTGFLPVLSLFGILAISGLSLMLPREAELVHPLLGLPVLFAASQLQPPVARAVTAVAVAADAAVMFVTVPPLDAVFHVLYVAPELVLITALLVQAMNRQEQLIGELCRHASIDPLTGLVTRRVFNEALAQALSTEPQTEGTALILVDVDKFKPINDTHGHLVGDDALTHLAGVLTKQIRTGDAVIGRLGGDELAVLLPGCGFEVAVRRADQLVSAVRAAPLPLPDGSALPLSVSVGVAHAPRNGTELRDLYEAADAALYQSKKAGRGRASVAGAV